MNIHGIGANQVVWQPDFKSSRDKKGEWTATQSYKCKASDFLTTLPKLGEPAGMEGFGFLGLVTVNVTALEGGLVQVHCKYGATSTASGGGGGGGGNENIDDKTSLEGGTSEEPIQFSESYYDKVAVDFTDKVINGIYKLKTKDDSEVWIDTSNGDKEVKDSDIQKMTTIDGKSPDPTLTKECARLIAYGETHYLTPTFTWVYRGRKDKMLTAGEMNKIGKIDFPDGSPPPTTGKRNWLLVDLSQEKEGKYYNITKTWMLSSARGWNEKIYK